MKIEDVQRDKTWDVKVSVVLVETEGNDAFSYKHDNYYRFIVQTKDLAGIQKSLEIKMELYEDVHKFEVESVKLLTEKETPLFL